MTETWREWAASWGLPEEAFPARRDLGRRYPWRRVMLHAFSPALGRRIDAARRHLDAVAEHGIDWRAGLSCGKDSTALALLLADHGWTPSAMSVKDDLDYPGEREYLAALSSRTGIAVDVLTPERSLESWLLEHRISLVHDLHSRAAELSATWFYGLLDRYRAVEGYDGVLLGLRAAESRGRAFNHALRGTVYRRADGLTVAQPIADWSTLDVHAYLWRCGVPVLPLYLCVEEGVAWDRLRKSWWVVGDESALRQGHYVWLRRWWPALWERALAIDPEVATVSR